MMQQAGGMAPPALRKQPCTDEVRTLWIGNLLWWMDEPYLTNCFINTGDLVSAKLIRNKQTTMSEGYGFLEFRSRAAAESVLQSFKGAIMPYSGQTFRMNWAQRTDNPTKPEPDFFVERWSGYGTDETFKNLCHSLWIWGLQHWMDETYLTNCFYNTGTLVSAKVFKSEGCGYLEFKSREAAESAVFSFFGFTMPNSEQTFQLSFASLDSVEHLLFVGDLAGDVTDNTLLETFKYMYKSVERAKVVVTDGVRYGFVFFGDERERKQAITEMNGTEANKKPISAAPTHQSASYQSSQGRSQDESDPNNTTIFVGGLDPSETEDSLRQVFSQCGELVHVKILVGKRCAFVRYADRSCAEQALSTLNGTMLGGQNIRLSWRLDPSSKQSDQGPGAGGYYGYSQYPSSIMYYGGYPGYGYYQQPQPIL